MRAFFRAYGTSVDPVQTVNDLHQRDYSDLLQHPLLLTLACITRSNRTDVGSRSVTALIEGALQTLSMRWDQSKGFTRESTTPLDGTARVKCLKRLAFGAKTQPPYEPTWSADRRDKAAAEWKAMLTRGELPPPPPMGGPIPPK